MYVDFEDPKASGVDGGRNFNIEFKSKVDNCNIRLGVWHILPKSAYEKLKGNFEETTDKEELNKLMDAELKDSKYPIIIYCHGNSNCRATSHRVQLYNFFQKMDYHTIAFDYRGYGDSTNVPPSEDGVVEDALIVYDWLNTTIEKAPAKPPVYFWGHSLGTGISSHLLGNLDKLSKNILERSNDLPRPNGLILEAPFNTLEDAAKHYPVIFLVSWLPYFESMFVDPLTNCPEHSFRSSEHLARESNLPVLLLHAKDDRIVPHVVGEKLYKAVLASRAAGGATIKLNSFDVKENLGHKFICLAKDLPQIVGAILLTGASLTASVLVLQVAVLPLLFKYNKSVQRKIVFSNCINYPKNLDFERPSSCNVLGCSNYKIDFQSTVDKCPIKLGVWHIIPCSLFRELFVIHDNLTLEERLHNELKRTQNTIVLYCHGNSNHRASPHRLQLYKVFQEMNFHVITFDYRGYGDSTRVRPTEDGVVEDALQVYAWLMGCLKDNEKRSVVIWGHSLGSSIAANLVSHLDKLCLERGVACVPPPQALVLEAPFNNLLEEIEGHPFSKFVSWLPYYKDSFVKPFSSEYTFATDQYLSSVTNIPVLMLHSKGDKIVPYDLAVKV
ncbi:unnamed protein product [Euphydryas editha]|uniref:AB hydrolase-1 domain-containing protein n=1 Tax=Euphydryas editha TaxID=104508 RepID=A0AAU9UGC4_EUPED|nr:unnamed protein product [Euphydryas editha]